MEHFLNKRVLFVSGNFKGNYGITTEVIEDDLLPYGKAVTTLLDNGKKVMIEKLEHFMVIDTAENYLVNKWIAELREDGYSYDAMEQIFKMAREKFNQRKKNDKAVQIQA